MPTFGEGNAQRSSWHACCEAKILLKTAISQCEISKGLIEAERVRLSDLRWNCRKRGGGWGVSLEAFAVAA